MIRIVGGAFVKSMKAARVAVAKAVYRAVQHAAELARDHAKATTLFKDRSNDLRKSIRARVVDNTHAVAEATSNHAEWIERGNGFRTGAEFIYPKRAPFLVFTVDGTKFVARKVKTSKPRPFMEQAGKYAEPLFTRMCRDAVDGMFG